MKISRLALKVVVSLLCVIFLIFTISSTLEYRKSRQSLEADVARLHKTVLANVLDTIAKSLWNMDESLLETASRSVFQLGDFAEFAIYDDSGKLFIKIKRDGNSLNKLNEGSLADDLPQGKVGEPIDPRPIQSLSTANPLDKIIALPTQEMLLHRLAADVWLTVEEGQEPTRVGYVTALYSSESVSKRLADTTQSIIVLALLLGLAIVASIMTVLQFSVIHPIRALTATSLKVSHGDYSARVKATDSKDEIGVLSGNFNRMVNQIEGNNKRLSGIVRQSRTIASKVIVEDIGRAILETVRSLGGESFEVLLVFGRNCFQDLPPSIEFLYFHETSNRFEQTHPLQSNELFSNRARVVEVTDPKTFQLLARIHLLSPDDQETQTLIPTIEALTTSIAGAINTVRLQHSMEIIAQKSQEMEKIFAFIKQGICMIDSEMRIRPQYSKHLATILGVNDLQHRSISHLLFDRAHMSSDRRDQFVTACDSMFGEPLWCFDANAHLLPSEFEIIIGKERQILEVDWIPLLGSDDKIAQVMLTLRDVTELRQLAMTAEASRRHLQIIRQVLDIEPTRFAAFSRSTLEMFGEIETLARSMGQDGVSTLILRNLHTLKGNARVYGLIEFAEQIHHSESLTIQLREQLFNGSKSPTEVREDLQENLRMCQEAFQEYLRVNRDVLNRENQVGMIPLETLQKAVRRLEEEPTQSWETIRDGLLAACYASIESILAPVINNLPSVAGKLETGIPAIDLRMGVRPYFQSGDCDVLNAIFTHLVSNAMSHSLSKTGAGRMSIEVQKSDRQLEVSISDDGRGFNIAKLEELARAKNIQARDDSDLLELVFGGNMSTADRLTDISGRGVGMGVVREMAQRLGGNFHIEFIDDRRTGSYRRARGVLTIPLDRLASLSLLSHERHYPGLERMGAA
jgi:HAMP domain-containing protein/anti-sigma regulatory factor (Ser/Thr protein kinase)